MICAVFGHLTTHTKSKVYQIQTPKLSQKGTQYNHQQIVESLQCVVITSLELAKSKVYQTSKMVTKRDPMKYIGNIFANQSCSVSFCLTALQLCLSALILSARLILQCWNTPNNLYATKVKGVCTLCSTYPAIKFWPNLH